MAKNPTTLSTLDGAELPSTMPVVNESASHRLVWKREIQNAQDERELIEYQIESAGRVCQNSKDEAVRIRDARISYANSAMDREYADAEKILAAATANLRSRQNDLGRVIDGFEAAIDASSPNKSDGVQS